MSKIIKMLVCLVFVICCFGLPAFAVSLIETPSDRIDIISTFPDSSFCNHIQIMYDKNHDSYLSPEEISNVTYIWCENDNIANLSGIEVFTELQYLDCPGNKLTSLDLRSNTKLEYINCDDNQLTSIDVRGITTLRKIIVRNNQLTDLDIAGCTSLMCIWCKGNPSLKLDITTCPDLVRTYTQGQTDEPGVYELSFYSEDKNSIIVDPEIDILYDAGTESFVSINPGLFPDKTFRDYIKHWCDLNGDDQLSNVEISLVTRIDCEYYYNIASMSGVEIFTDLTCLNCAGNRISSIDLSHNKALTVLAIYDNQLSELDVSNNTGLIELHCDNNRLTSLDVSKNTSLTTLYFSDNRLSEIDISHNGRLRYLGCRNNPLSVLDLTYCYTLLTNYLSGDRGSNDEYVLFDDHYARKSELWIDEEQAVIYVDGKIPLHSSYFPDANFLSCVMCFDTDEDGFLSPEEIDSVTELRCYDEDIYDLSGIEFFTSLRVLQCDFNHLSTLDLSQNTKLVELDCCGNRLTKLNLEKSPFLTVLDCSINSINELIIPDTIEKLNCSANGISRLNYSDFDRFDKMEEFVCYANKLEELHLWSFRNLKKLICSVNPLPRLDVSDCPRLTYLDCRSTMLTELDIKSCPCLIECYTSAAYANDGHHYNEYFLKYDQGVKIKYTENYAIDDFSFPDEHFRNYVLSVIDTDHDGTLSTAEISSVTSINCSGMEITSLKGIECFTGLTTLDCSMNQLTSLKGIERFAELTTLDCSMNQLTSLDISNNPALEILHCQDNDLSRLDILDHPALLVALCRGSSRFSFDPNISFIDLPMPLAVLTIPAGTAKIGSEAFANAFLSIIRLNAACRVIDSRAFAENPDLILVDAVDCADDIQIAIDAFADCGDRLFFSTDSQAIADWAQAQGFHYVFFDDD